MTRILNGKNFALFLKIAAFGFTAFMLFSFSVTAQDKRAITGEIATCEVKVSKTKLNTAAVKNTEAAKEIVRARLNQNGFFDRVPAIRPMEIVPITVTYPAGIVGEKVLLSAEDGGKFENGKRIMISQINAEKALVFNFRVSDQTGIFHVTLRKGNDTKVVQLWVVPEPARQKNYIPNRQ